MRPNFKLITRNFAGSRYYQFLNITGLAIGFACVFTIIAWLKYEFSYDKYLPDAERTYRLTFETRTSGNTLHFARCWEKWISQIPVVFPQVKELVRLEPYRHTALKIGENKFYSDRVFATDSNFFKVFGIRLLSGDLENVLKEPFSAVISSSIAKKCFGDINPVGQTFTLSGEYDEKMIPFTIKGLMEDTPVNSHIHFDILTSFAKPEEPPAWAYVYLLLGKNTSPQDILEGFPSFIQEVEKDNPDRVFIPHLQKITDIHLFSDKDREAEPNGNLANIFLFTAITLVLLLISWANYYNLNKARIPDLAKQIHIQTIMGAGNRIIIMQSVLESAFCVFVAVILSFIILMFADQASGFFTGYPLLTDRNSGLLNIWPFITIVFITSVLSGSLPLILYTLDQEFSLKDIKKKHKKEKSGFSQYGILIGVQFFLAIVLIIAAITINRQKEYMFSEGTGKMDSDILVFKKQNWEVRFKYQAFRSRALQDPLIKSVSASMEEPTGETLDALQVESPEIDENHKGRPLFVLSVEDNFLDFFNLRLIAGRNFSSFNPERKGEDYILNETAVKQLGWTADEAIGRPFKILFDSPEIFYGGTVVGVVHDFYYTSMKKEIKPYVMFQKPIFYLCFLVKVDHERREEAVLNLKKIWEDELPDYPFQYEFLSDLYKSSYRKELTQSNLTSFFSVLAMLIICLGLISVTSVLLARRIKEIGIRKVNGANIWNILTMLNSFFIRWFVIAFIIACPVAWYASHKWLQNFVYRTDVKWWGFVLAGFLVLAVTLITVSFQAWRAARKNPVEALRYE